MHNIKQTANTVKNTVIKHRAKIAAVTTFVVMVKLNQMAQAEQLDFIKSKGLLEEYLTPES